MTISEIEKYLKEHTVYAASENGERYIYGIEHGYERGFVNAVAFLLEENKKLKEQVEELEKQRGEIDEKT